MFKVKISLDRRGQFIRRASGNIEEIITGLLTTLEEIIYNEKIDKKEILDVWGKTNMRDMIKRMEENNG